MFPKTKAFLHQQRNLHQQKLSFKKIFHIANRILRLLMSQNFVSKAVKQNANHTDPRPCKTLSVVTVIPTCAQV